MSINCNFLEDQKFDYEKTEKDKKNINEEFNKKIKNINILLLQLFVLRCKHFSETIKIEELEDYMYYILNNQCEKIKEIEKKIIIKINLNNEQQDTIKNEFKKILENLSLFCIKSSKKSNIELIYESTLINEKEIVNNISKFLKNPIQNYTIKELSNEKLILKLVLDNSLQKSNNEIENILKQFFQKNFHVVNIKFSFT